MPKQPVITEGQGSFLEIEHSSGLTEAIGYTATAHIVTVNPEGVFQEAVPEEPYQSDPVIDAQLKEEKASRNRSRSQLGKHSALDENGHYSNVKPGSYLPGFGPVTYRNLGAAEAVAANLSGFGSKKK